MISKEEIFESRRKAAKELDLFIRTYKEDVIDSETVKREVIWNKNGNIATLGFADETSQTRVEPNPYDADLLVFEGGARIEFDNGKEEVIKKGKRHIFIPKFTGFTVFSTHVNTAVLTYLDTDEKYI